MTDARETQRRLKIAGHLIAQVTHLWNVLALLHILTNFVQKVGRKRLCEQLMHGKKTLKVKNVIFSF